MKKIAVLTYTTKHRKTYDVLCLLKANGYCDVKVYATPFSYKKKLFPKYSHRPEMNFSIPDIASVCLNLGYAYFEGDIDSFDIEDDRIVLIAGAGILSDEFVGKHIVLNAHPGYIPNCRGLDAFKWAIVEKQPIGVTTHLIGEYVDAGDVIERRIIPVYDVDTFHAVSERVYENEIAMLIEAIEKYDPDNTTFIEPREYELHRRMPIEIEENLLIYFSEYQKEYGIKNKTEKCGAS